MTPKMNHPVKPAFLIAGFCLLAATTSRAAIADGFKVIVSQTVSASSVTKEEVKQILLANQTTWKDGKKVTIVALSPDADGADAAAMEYMGMTSAQAKKYWLTKVFSGVLPSQPPLGDSADEVVEKVANTSGAIAIVPKGTKLGKTKVVFQQ